MKKSMYIPFKPIANNDLALCGHSNCRAPFEAHSHLGYCPFKDGSGFSLTQHFIREKKELSFADAEVRVFALLCASVGELAADLEEIG